MRGNGRVRSGDEEAPRHAEMDEELSWLLTASEVDDDRLADTMDAVDTAAGEDLDDLVRRRLEGLGLVAGPHGADGLPVDALVNAIGDGFDFWEFGHGYLSIGGLISARVSRRLH